MRANRSTAHISAAEPGPLAIRNFADSLKGELILPGDKRYGKARRVHNHAFNLRPAIIVRSVNREDVIRSVEFARRSELLTAVRSGGHSYAGHGVCEGGMVLDLSLMKRAAIDPGAELVTIEPGVTSGELDCISQAYKMAVPLGSCQAVGVAGYSLAGGESSLTTKFGYGCDNINCLEVVTADGEILHASETENADLFWAMRGAGANFGIAASLEFRLHRIERVLSGHLKYPIRRAKKVLKFIGGWASTIPDELALTLAVLPHPGERMLDVAVVWSGDEKKGERVLRPLRTFLKPFEDSIKPMAYLDQQRAGSDTPREGDYSSHRRGGHFERLTDETIELITEYASSAPSASSGITMMYWHGPWCAQPHDNAFGFRRVGYEYWVHSYWQMAGERKKSWDWVEEFFAPLQPQSTGAVYVNDLENEGPERVRAAYGDKYERLAQLKRKYDPDNFFRVNQNIMPAR